MLGFNALASSPISALAEVSIFITATLDATAVVAPNLTLEQPLSGTLSATALNAGNAVLDHALVATLDATAVASPLLVLDQPLAASISATAVATPLLVLDQPLAASENATAVTSGNAVLDQPLAASENATAVISGNVVLDQSMAAALDVTAVATPLLVLEQAVGTSVVATAITAASVVLDQPLAASENATAVISGNVVLENPIAASENVTAVISGNVVLENPIAASENVTAVTTGNITLVNQLDQNLSATANTSALLVLEQEVAASVNATVVVDPLLVLDQPLSASESTTATATATLFSGVNAAAAIDASATISPVPLDKLVDLSGSLDASATIVGYASNSGVVEGLMSAAATVSASLSVDKLLSANITATAEAVAESIKLIFCDISCTATTAGLLDVDGNTEGSPGGFADLGFTPLSSVVLAQHVESAPVATYTITADFDPLLETEITSVFFNDNPANVLSYSIIGPDVFITANTPADVYAQASTFMVKREVVPYYNESFNYNVRFNTAVKRENAGNNFYSNKFYSDQNAICYLSDDGLGIIDLYEEVTPGNSVKLKSIGKIDYTTGNIEVKGLVITSLYDLQLFFYVESLDSVIPTQDYFTTQNNLLVQNKTITFPTGEQVEISQYEKQTDIVDLEIYVTARSYSLADPLTTVEERTATYVIRFIPDYDLGKAAIQQLVAEQAV